MNDYIPRDITATVETTAKYYQVIVMTGPRQSGKSTVCRHIFPQYAYYTLEDIQLRERIKEDPKGFFNNCGSEIILDEAQHYPELFSYIQVIVDADPKRRFVITGSSNFGLMQGITQSLAGRAALFTLLPLSLTELGIQIWKTRTDELLQKGFYPALFSKGIPSNIFYSNYTSTYVERDVRQLLELKNHDRFMRFLRLCALRIGAELNKADMAKSVGVSATTIGDWLSILRASYIVFTLSPYYSNVAKRLTKTPKIYFYDTGLACYLMGIEEPDQLRFTAMKGALFENLAILELMKRRMNEGRDPNLMFYRENSGKEVDIIDDRGTVLNLYEVKSSSTFKPEYMSNMRYVESLLQDKKMTATLIYDGESQPPAILNIRNL